MADYITFEIYSNNNIPFSSSLKGLTQTCCSAGTPTYYLILSYFILNLHKGRIPNYYAQQDRHENRATYIRSARYEMINSEAEHVDYKETRDRLSIFWHPNKNATYKGSNAQHFPYRRTNSVHQCARRFHEVEKLIYT